MHLRSLTPLTCGLSSRGTRQASKRARPFPQLHWSDSSSLWICLRNQGISYPYKHSGCSKARLCKITVEETRNLRVEDRRNSIKSLAGIRSLNISDLLHSPELSLAQALSSSPLALACFGHLSWKWCWKVQCLDLDTNKMVCMKIIKNDKAGRLIDA